MSKRAAATAVHFRSGDCWVITFLVHEVRHGDWKNHQAKLDALQAGAVTGFLWDDEPKGFGLKITAGGSTSYVVQYRMGGREAKTRRYTIGGHGSPWTPFFQAITFDTELTVEEVVQVAPNWAFVRTSSNGHVTVNAIEQRVPDANHELFIFQKGDDQPRKSVRNASQARRGEWMDWTAISAVSGRVQSVVVVASLWYVIVQLRQSTKAMIASSFQEILEAGIGIISDYMQQGVDPRFIGWRFALSS